MRYAFVSDIHANLPAWKNVLADLADLSVDRVICLGDVVGYGPDPAGVLDLLYRKVHATLLGNHDAAVCGKIDPSLFSPRAQAAVLRHRQQLSREGLAWLAARPLVLAGPGFRCAHGDFSAPGAFRYVIDPHEALPSWSATREQLLFVGHSHLPAIYVIGGSGEPHLVGPCDFQLEEGKRYIVNPGSVGYPRVGECRSTYCVYDDADRSVVFRSLPFDSEGYRASLREAGLDDDPWMGAPLTPRHLPTLRQRLSFSNPLADGQHARDVRAEARLGTRRRALGVLAGALVLASLALAAGSAARSARHRRAADAALMLPREELPLLVSEPRQPDKNMLPAFPPALSADASLAGWRYACEDRARQTLATCLRNGELALSVTHAGNARFRLESPLIMLARSEFKSLRLSGHAEREEGFAPHDLRYQLVVYAMRPDGTPEIKKTYSYTLGVKGDTLYGVNRKIDALAQYATHVQVRLDAEFSGTLVLRAPTLTYVRAAAPAPAAQEARQP